MRILLHALHPGLSTSISTPSPTTDISLHFDTQSSSLLRSTCPNHRSLLRTTRSATPTIPNRSNNPCELFLSFSDTPHIHLTIILSVLSNCCVSLTFNAHVSLPYTKTLCTHALYIFPFIFRDIPLNVKIGDSSLNFPHAHLTLVLTASIAPPPQPSISPK